MIWLSEVQTTLDLNSCFPTAYAPLSSRKLQRFQVNGLFSGHTPLHAACLNGQADVVECLITHDVDLEIEVGLSLKSMYVSTWFDIRYASNGGGWDIGGGMYCKEHWVVYRRSMARGQRCSK